MYSKYTIYVAQVLFCINRKTLKVAYFKERLGILGEMELSEVILVEVITVKKAFHYGCGMRSLLRLINY